MAKDGFIRLSCPRCDIQLSVSDSYAQPGWTWICGCNGGTRMVPVDQGIDCGDFMILVVRDYD
jgi:hypothetical protein